MVEIKDGVYTIRNTGRSLMLDLKGNSPVTGNAIQGYEANGTVAQQWIIKRQSRTASTYSIQTNNSDAHGNGFFFPPRYDEGEKVVYYRRAVVVNLIDAGNDEYKIGYTLGSDKLVLALPGSQTEVALANDAENPRYRWTLKFVAAL
ncbi:hypothetical protein BDP27DRAFT_1369309 [Rhodocollybia butyracea]|uniref:Ricin B lectin domain-containing protein n=1 Tax=Rhodocollybia butyracea TaxID=206335 RepID=A0A9P5PES5_9AGAR|nr:hypothetical protein BDP27DRAFT_1440548 [Rhodocollybia butyracea]KAF9061837.1 hypothetical protein BDP27DRAFT_1369309 [Rhodocollybia butyracea]